MQELKKYHEEIKQKITQFFEENQLITKPKDQKIYEYLKEYSLRGKLIRGSLILLACETLTGKITQEAIITATSIEILHSSILVIDDIIDKDDTRRGKPAMHITTKDLIPQSKDVEHDAKSIAECVGLIGTYSAYGLLAQTNLDVIKEISQEFTKTGFAELNEIILAQQNSVSEEDVMNIYKHKTAKYTITLPIKLGYILSGEEFTKELEQITDNIGIIFQIKDDLLELEANEEDIGKSNISDIKAGKEHYPRKQLEKTANKEDLEEINKAYKTRTEKDVKLIQEMYAKYEIVQKTNKEIQKITQETLALIEKQNPKIQPILKTLLEYVQKRKY